MSKRNKILLLIPALWASLFDIAMTLIHQPPDYWNGDLTKRNEANPIGAMFMESHVSGLFIISGIWLVTIGLLGYFLPRLLSKGFLLFCLLAHSVGASTWLSGKYGFGYVIAFLLFNTLLYCAIDSFINRKRNELAA
jgi:hypothetical protein